MIIPKEVKELQSLNVPSRTNCVFLIKTDELINHDSITISKEEINCDVITAKSISPVINGNKIDYVVNQSEQPFVYINYFQFQKL